MKQRIKHKGKKDMRKEMNLQTKQHIHKKKMSIGKKEKWGKQEKKPPS